MPRKAFIASWIVTGYFQRSHFGEDGMTAEEARDYLDGTGLQRQLGIGHDMVAVVPSHDRQSFWGQRNRDLGVAVIF